MDVNYDNGLFEPHGAVIENVQMTEDGMVLDCVYRKREQIHVAFHTVKNCEGIVQLAGHAINYISVSKDGYSVYLLDQEEAVIVEASSYSIEWE